MMDLIRKTGKTTLLVLILGALFFSSRAKGQAQPATSTTKEANADNAWRIDFTPYIWFSGIHGTVGALGHQAELNAGFGDIFNYLNIGLKGTFEVRHNRVLMPVDFIWLKLSDNRALPLNDAGVESINAKMTQTIITPQIGYRIADEKKAKVDAVFGARIWHLTTDLTLQPRLATGFSQSAAWADAVAGGRIQVALGPKASVMVLGDAGGGSASHDFQAAALLGYQISRRWVVLGGYRYLSVNYQPNGKFQFVYDVNTPGLVLGATFHIR